MTQSMPVLHEPRGLPPFVLRVPGKTILLFPVTEPNLCCLYRWFNKIQQYGSEND